MATSSSSHGADIADAHLVADLTALVRERIERDLRLIGPRGAKPIDWRSVVVRWTHTPRVRRLHSPEALAGLRAAIGAMDPEAAETLVLGLALLALMSAESAAELEDAPVERPSRLMGVS